MTPHLGAVHASDKLQAPAALRNQAAILAVLQEELPAAGTVLELASGSGTHACFFANALAPLRWLPTDRSDEALKSIAAWRAEQSPHAPLGPRQLDCLDTDWPVTDILDLQALVAINLLHVAPWSVSSALFQRAAQFLPTEGVIIIYGPFRRGDDFMSIGNQQFDYELRTRDAQLGLRDIAAVTAAAVEAGWRLATEIAMPANNLTLVWRR